MYNKLNQYTLPEFSSMSTKQWLQVEAVGNEIVMHLLLSFISSLHFKPLSVPIEANSGSVYFFNRQTHKPYIDSLSSDYK